MTKDERQRRHEALDRYIDIYEGAISEMYLLAEDESASPKAMVTKALELVLPIGGSMAEVIFPEDGIDPVIIPTFIHVAGALHEHMVELFTTTDEAMGKDEEDELMEHFWDGMEEYHD